MTKKERTDLLQGTLELLVLRLLRSGPLNGWEMMQRIELVSDQVLSVTPGSLYPTLHRLEAEGLVSAAWRASANNRRAKFYSITAAGKRRLAADQDSWERFAGAVGAILRRA